MQVQVIRWQEATAPQEQDIRRRMQEQGLAPHLWSNGPYDTYAIHSHTYEKVLYCLRGSIRFELFDPPGMAKEKEVIDLAPGDCLILPPGIRHSAYVGPQGVTCIEAPRYEDKLTR